MKTKNLMVIDGQGPIVAFSLLIPDEANLPDPEEEVENAPPMQPDVDPLEREDPEIDKDIDEIKPDDEEAINERYKRTPNIDRNPTVEPDTDPMGD